MGDLEDRLVERAPLVVAVVAAVLVVVDER